MSYSDRILLSPSDASVSREDFKKLTEYLGSGGGNCTPRPHGYEPCELLLLYSATECYHYIGNMKLMSTTKMIEESVFSS